MYRPAHAWVIVAWTALLDVVNRHWLIGFENAALTLLLGSGLVVVIRSVAGPIASPKTILGLRRTVYLAALYKSALYFILGDSLLITRYIGRVSCGVQFPDPYDLIWSEYRTIYSIWRPAPLTADVSFLLIVYMLGRLAQRAVSMRQVRRAVSECVMPLDPDVADHVSTLLGRAAGAISRSDLASTTIVVVEESFKGSPFVVGFRNPHIVIASSLLHRLLEHDQLLEAALRHELMHIARRDHIFRWIQVCFADVSSLLVVSSRLNIGAIGFEEQLCDIGAIKEPADAKHLSMAIVEASRSDSFKNVGFADGSRAVTMPGLICLTGKTEPDQTALVVRLKAVLAYTQTLNSRAKHASRSGVSRCLEAMAAAARWTASLALLCLLLLLLWAKFYVFWMVP
jgi:Zn-dependent protease with chaperone function